MAKATARPIRRVSSRSRVAGSTANNTPVNADAGVERRQLLARCAEAADSRLILVEAPPGFGKTQFLAQWSRQQGRAGVLTVWMSLRRTDTEGEAFAQRLLATLKLSGLKRPPQAPSGTESNIDTSMESFATEFAHGIRNQRRRVVLILDNYQVVEGGSTDVLLRYLFEQLPANLQICLASRRTCPISSSRALLQGWLQLIRSRDLLFSKAEAREFYGHSAGARRISELHSLTEGWPAALRIAKLWVPAWSAGSGDTVTAPEFWRLIGDYCNREVLGHIDSESLGLLIATSHLEALDPAVCDAIRHRDDSLRILSQIAARETFLDPVDAMPKQWRLSGLLRDCLEQRAAERGAQSVAAAKIGAASYYERTGRTSDALRYYMAAGDIDAAAGALERAAPFVLISEQGDTFGAELLKLIPEAQLQTHPRLALCQVYLDHKRGLIDEARASLRGIAKRTRNFTEDRPGGDDTRLQIEAWCVELTVEFYDRTCASLDYINSIESQLPLVNKGDVRLAVFYHLVLCLLYRLRGDAASSDTHFIQMQKLTARHPAPWTELWLKYHTGAHALAAGQLMEARSQLQSGLKLWQARFRNYGTFQASAKVFLAEIDYENDALSEARSKLGEGLYTIEHIEGWFELYASLYETAMMLHWHAGEFDEAEGLLARGRAVRRVGELLGRLFAVLRVRFEILRGRLGDALDLVHKHHLEQEWNSPNHQDTFSYREWDLIGVCLCHIAIANRDFTRARQVVELLEQEARHGNRGRTIVKALVLYAAIESLDGNESSALSLMLRALQHAHPLGYRRVFLDESALILPLLGYVSRGAADAVSAPIAAYAKSLCDALAGTAKDSRVDQSALSQRETDVIRELSRGLSNKLIARKLGLSSPTVKFHVNNIFRKLRVHKRAAAVAEAHGRGWLSC
jgi:LuxR family maltose regulon positive regulatory protein